MSAIENLEQVDNLISKTKQVKKYEEHQKKIESLKKENVEKTKIICNEDNSIQHSYYDAQVKANEKGGVILSWFINIVSALIACLATYLMYKPFIQSLHDLFAKFEATPEASANPQKWETLTSVMDGIYSNLNIFIILGMISLITFTAFLMVNSISKYYDSKYDALNTITLLATIGLKIANIVIFIIMFYNYGTVEVEFLPDYMEMANVGSGIFTLLLITVGIHVALFLISAISNPDTLKGFLDSTILKGARKKDKKYFKQNKEYLFKGIKKEIEENKVKILQEENAFPSSKVREIIKEIENESPIFCDFYELTTKRKEKEIEDKEFSKFEQSMRALENLDKTSENLDEQYIKINSEKFTAYCKNLEDAKEMIKTGRASNIKDALNVIEKDRQDSARTSAIHAQAYELGKLNDQMSAYSDYDDYY